MAAARLSLRQQAQRLVPCGNRCSQFNAAAYCLACGIRGFGFDAQPCRKVGFSQVERLFEETACLLRQSGTALCRSELSACGIDACNGGIPLPLQTRLL